MNILEFQNSALQGTLGGVSSFDPAPYIAEALVYAEVVGDAYINKATDTAIPIDPFSYGGISIDGGMLVIDGVSYNQITHISLNEKENITWATWLKFYDGSTGVYKLTDNASFGFSLLGGGSTIVTSKFYTPGYSNWGLYENVGSLIPRDEWFFFVGTFSPSSETVAVGNVYINGELIATEEGPANSLPMGPEGIMSLVHSSLDGITGQIDSYHLSIYERTLTVPEMIALGNGTAPAGAPVLV